MSDFKAELAENELVAMTSLRLLLERKKQLLSLFDEAKKDCELIGEQLDKEMPSALRLFLDITNNISDKKAIEALRSFEMENNVCSKNCLYADLDVPILEMTAFQETPRYSLLGMPLGFEEVEKMAQALAKKLVSLANAERKRTIFLRELNRLELRIEAIRHIST